MIDFDDGHQKEKEACPENRRPPGADQKVAAKKPAKAKKSAAKKPIAKKPIAKKPIAKKPIAKKKAAKKAAAPKRKPMSAAKAGAPGRGRTKEKVYPMPTLEKEPGPRSGMMSGDLQGVSGSESADSESVDELLEEGNAFEAGIVEGVERADDRAERPVRTRQMREDDVPQEYLDKD